MIFSNQTHLGNDQGFPARTSASQSKTERSAPGKSHPYFFSFVMHPSTFPSLPPNAPDHSRSLRLGLSEVAPLSPSTDRRLKHSRRLEEKHFPCDGTDPRSLRLLSLSLFRLLSNRRRTPSFARSDRRSATVCLLSRVERAGGRNGKRG